MSQQTTAREALIAEALGEIALLIARVDTLSPELQAACESIDRARADMQAQASQLDGKISHLSEVATEMAVRHIARRTEGLARNTMANQTRAMEAAARQIFNAELPTALRRLSETLAVARTPRTTIRRSWTLAATAGAASLASAALTAYVMSTWPCQ